MHIPVFILCGSISILALANFILYYVSPNPMPKVGQRKRRFGLFLTGAALGNALLQLQVITQPHVKHVIVQMSDEDAADEESGDPDHPADPLIHLHRQAARIRRGEQVEPITTIVNREPFGIGSCASNESGATASRI